MNRIPAYLDIESYPNYFLAQIVLGNGKAKSFELHEDGEPLNCDELLRILQHPAIEVYTFNGNGYDLPMLRCALRGANTKSLHRLSVQLVTGQLRPWQVEQHFPQHPAQINHVDLIEVAPGVMDSLKVYGGRLHVEHLQDLPFPPGTVLSTEQKAVVRRYCRNDTVVTQTLHESMRGEIELRRTMSEKMNAELHEAGLFELHGPIDLRSKSDAQIAEAVLCHRVLLATAIKPKKHPIAYKSFFYEPPSYIRYSSQQLKDTLALVRSAKMVIGDSGHVVMPKEIEQLTITINGTSYKLGIGGLHSQESEVSHYADDETVLRDLDVRSYYPNLILNTEMYPTSFGPHFLTAYRNILTERLDAKDEAARISKRIAELESMDRKQEILTELAELRKQLDYHKSRDAAFKISLNGTFGKTSSPYSPLYNPKMMVATTLTGQLSMLMLIELLERGGIHVVSANTDGIVLKFPRRLEELQRRIVSVWEKVTKLETEATDYLSIHSRDVNSYVAIKPGGKVKTKGAFALPGSLRERMMKNPQNEVCVDAVIEYLVNRTPLEQTIRECRDVRKFLTLRRVTGGASKDGEEVGKVVRWYYSTGTSTALTYVTNGNLVPKSTGARPLMTLDQEFPDDVDYDRYVVEAEEMLFSLGVVERPVYPKLPRRNSKAWKLLESQGLVTVSDEGKPVWAVPLSKIPTGQDMAA